MTSLLETITLDLAESLKRSSATTCSRWSEYYLVTDKPIPGPLRFLHHPWSRTWYDDNQDWVGKKAAQMAMSQACIARALFNIDILHNSVLYILPKMKPDATDFSKTKFDPLLDHSPHLQKLFTSTLNVNHKQAAGGVSLFIRGSKSRSALKAISVGLKIFDEYDEMNQNNISLAEQRSAGYKEEDVQTIKVSTPTFPDYGIDKAFKVSNKQHYIFKCPCCSRFSELLPESLIITTDDPEDRAGLRKSYLICLECKHPLPENKFSYINESNCHWHKTTNSDLNGYWIPAYYSLVRPLHDIAKLTLEAESDPIKAQELNNSVRATEYIPEGARINPNQVDACRSTYPNGDSPKSPLVTMGVDVGHKVLYYHIDEWLLGPLGPNINNSAVPRSLKIGTVASFAQLSELLYAYQVIHAVVDVDPESREATTFVQDNPGRVHLCRFVRGINKREFQPEATNSIVIQVNRTAWLDMSLSRYIRAKNGILLPINLPDNYAQQIGALLKHQYKDNEGNIKAKYVTIGNNGSDHFAFARTYSEIALPLALSVSENKDVKEFL